MKAIRKIMNLLLLSSVLTVMASCQSGSSDANGKVKDFTLHVVDYDNYFDYLDTEDEKYYTEAEDIKIGKEYVMFVSFEYTNKDFDRENTRFVLQNNGLIFRDVLSATSAETELLPGEAMFKYTNLNTDNREISCEILFTALSNFTLNLYLLNYYEIDGDKRFESEEDFEEYYKNSQITDLVYTVDEKIKGAFDFQLKYSGNGSIQLEKYSGNDEEVIVPEGVTYVSECAFSELETLKKVVLPSTLAYIPRMVIENCSNLESLTIPFVGESETENNYLGYIFGAKDYTINESYVPSSLKEVIITGSDITEISIDEFYFCTEVESITLPESILKISNFAFSCCSSLKSIVIPDRVTLIGDKAFKECTSLTDAIIPASVIAIGDGAFDRCESLTNITYKGTIRQWNEIEKDNNWDEYTGSYVIHCTDGDISK